MEPAHIRKAVRENKLARDATTAQRTGQGQHHTHRASSSDPDTSKSSSSSTAARRASHCFHSVQSHKHAAGLDSHGPPSGAAGTHPKSFTAAAHHALYVSPCGLTTMIAGRPRRCRQFARTRSIARGRSINPMCSIDPKQMATGRVACESPSSRRLRFAGRTVSVA